MFCKVKVLLFIIVDILLSLVGFDPAVVLLCRKFRLNEHFNSQVT